MTYAGDRVIFDADSHVMELPGWIEGFADAETRERIRPLTAALGKAGAMADDAVARAERRAARQGGADEVDLDEKLMTLKGWHAYGAFDPAERSRVLDHLGFAAQFVFSTFGPAQYLGGDVDLVAGGTRAHNRAMAAFCADDARLLAVANIPWVGPELTTRLTAEAIDEGCRAVHVPSVPGKGQVSPTHPDHDDLWRLLEERQVPLVCHVGGGGRLVPRELHDNGAPTSDWLGGGENIRSKDFMAIHSSTELLFSCLVLDGVLTRFPGLKVASIEQGASWVVPWLFRLDQAMQFARTEPRLQELGLKPSELVRRQMRFTPWPQEPIGWMIEQAGEELFLFSSDYPHPEGTKDPIARFEANLEGIGETARRRFYAGNMADLVGGLQPA